MNPPKLKTNRAQVHETHKVMTIRERLSKGWHDGIHLPLGPERGCTSRGGKLAAKEAHPLLKPSPRLRPPRSPQPTCCWWPPSSYLPLSAGTIFYFFFFFFPSGHNLHTHFLLPSSQQRPSLCSGWRAPSFFFLFFSRQLLSVQPLGAVFPLSSDCAQVSGFSACRPGDAL